MRPVPGGLLWPAYCAYIAGLIRRDRTRFTGAMRRWDWSLFAVMPYAGEGQRSGGTDGGWHEPTGWRDRLGTTRGGTDRIVEITRAAQVERGIYALPAADFADLRVCHLPCFLCAVPQYAE